MNKELKRSLETAGLIPVVKIDEAGHAVDLTKALLQAGLDCIEITFRTEAAAEAIEAVRKSGLDVVILAGTVLDVEQAERARIAGADVIVSPGYNASVVRWCLEQGMPVVPGIQSASELTAAVNAGLGFVKFFPAQAAGGIGMLKALSGPFPAMQFMPTGGISEDNFQEYLKLPQVVCAGGSWMVPTVLIQEGRFDEIQAIAHSAVTKMLDLKLAHIGINAANEGEAHQIAQFFETVFSFEARENPSSIFSDTYVETLKSPYLGKKGHIAISTPNVERAMAYLEKRGVAFNQDSIVRRPNGLIQAVYFQKETGSFAIHLVRKD
ncbi:bifunctional 4-hydroxy-2-oxoglutarate aldolase/2-dehydro-3-deoxy-phosphogluconate aldolase [uncultured Faecalibaculum sp.]|uniref:bifunctional 4-hydroxy-2-oxoglutarate aldolase/2-dehydro-3-deoxy-phosphogluconate aldolase n=1 Tax=uncultured Faecalibaculum sp. TaxID=1729681 RepID=UPI0025E8D8DA|nr:bifunctional 4-hydroxy-2-oxoglutarate aldolase/2-dehydro-3-deoxy-phosphogluconate aldolase [uncultured Faecalibaculum sp.]